MKVKHAAQIVAICGRNAELKAQLEAQSQRIPLFANVTLKVLGYTTEMDELMSASDLIVGKPGGLTTSEALAKGLVFVVVNPIPGQEERNSDHLLEKGCAIKCNNLPALSYKIDEILTDITRFQTMKENVSRLARPNSAVEIIRRLSEILNP